MEKYSNPRTFNGRVRAPCKPSRRKDTTSFTNVEEQNPNDEYLDTDVQQTNKNTNDSSTLSIDSFGCPNLGTRNALAMIRTGRLSRETTSFFAAYRGHVG